jgi:hypothetical protein
MSIDVSAHTLSGSDQPVSLDTAPDNCPLCHRSVHPIRFVVVFLKERDVCQAVFRCTHRQCQELFIATYGLNGPLG